MLVKSPAQVYSMIFSTLQWIGVMQNHLVGAASEESRRLDTLMLHMFSQQLVGGAPHTYSCIQYVEWKCLSE